MEMAAEGTFNEPFDTGFLIFSSPSILTTIENVH